MAVIILGSLFAGCVGSPDPDDEQQDPDEVDLPRTDAAEEIGVDLSSCGIIEAFSALEADRVRPHVPDDFAIATDASGRAIVVLGGLVCGEAGAASQRGLLAIMVEPLDEALSAGQDINHFWEPEHILVESTEIARAFMELGSNHTTAVGVTHEESLTSGEMHIDGGDWSHRITTSPGAGPGDEIAGLFGHFREYAAGDGGYVYLEARFQGNPGDTFGTGIATIETAEGSVSRELLGDGSQWPFLGGTGITYADAKVGFIPRTQA